MGLGIALVIFSGVMVGNCMLPLKYMRKWHWENVWIVFSLVALILMPWTIAILRVHHLLTVYGNGRPSAFMLPFLFGAGWGVAQVLFGLAVIRIGMALSFAITIGLSAALGSLVPILLKQPAFLATGRGSVLMAGMLLMLGGVAICSWAGRRRELEQRAQQANSTQSSFLSGLLFATGAGVLAPMLNFALAFGDSLITEAIHQQTPHVDAPYAVWPIALAGGTIPNLLYCLWLMKRNRTWGKFVPVWPEITLGAIMGALWMGSVAVYGAATTLMGVLGASRGWSVYQICIIFTANISGWIAGEWKGVTPLSKAALWVGLFVLGAATLAITYGNR